MDTVGAAADRCATRATPVGAHIVLSLYGIVACLALVLYLAAGARLSFLAALLGVPVLLVLVSAEWAAYSLIAVAVLQNLYPLMMTVGSFNVRFSHVVMYVMLLTTVSRLLLERRTLPRVPYLRWFAATLGVLAVSTVLNSPLVVRGIGTTMLLASNVAHYPVLYWLLVSQPGLYQKSLRAIGAIVIGVVALGTAHVILLSVDVPVISTALREIGIKQNLGLFTLAGDIRTVYRPYGWGTVSGCLLVSLIFCTLGCAISAHRRDRALYVVAAATGLLGVVISLARAPIAAFALSAGVFSALIMLRSNARVVLRYVLGIFAMVVLGAVALSLMRETAYVRAFTGRVLTMFEFGRGTAAPRIYTWGLMLRDIQLHPILGVGADAYRLYMAAIHQVSHYQYPSENTQLEILHSGGVMAAIPWLVAHVGIAALAVRQTRPGSPNRYVAVGLASGYLGSWVVGATASMTPTGSLYWIYIALLAALPRVGHHRMEPARSTPSTVEA